MSLPELIKKLTDISDQKPTASPRCEQSNGYAYLIKSVDYDATTNAAVIEIDDEP